MGVQLKNPPLIEAACEFRFDPASEWDWTVPGRLFDKIADEFPERAEVRRIGITVQSADVSAPSPAVIETGPDRVHLKRADGTAMVQVGPRLLAINQRRPYSNWEGYRALILKIYEAHCDIVGWQSIQRMGLRYINQISMDRREVEEILTVGPRLSSKLDRPISSFFQRFDLKHDDPEGTLVLQTGLQVVDDKPVVMLDLDFGSEEVGDIGSVEAVTDWLDRAHVRVEEGFINSLVPEFFDHLKKA